MVTNLKSTVIGFAAVVAIGGGGGFLLEPLGSSGRSEAATSKSPPLLVPARVVVEEVTGEAEVLSPGGTWRRVSAGETLERPTALRTTGNDAIVTVSQDTTRISLQHDARVLIGGGSSRLAVQLDAGRVLVHSRAGQVSVTAPAQTAVVSGDAFGVWARGDVLVAAVLDGTINIDTSNTTTQYTKGREVMLLPRGPTPVVMEPELRIELSGSAEKAGTGYRVTGRTLPSAVVYTRNGSRMQAQQVSSSGTFTAEIDGPVPKDGELVAFDAAGRRAEVNKPSVTLVEVLASIGKGASIANHDRPMVPPDENAKVKDPAKEEPKIEAEKADPKPEPDIAKLGGEQKTIEPAVKPAEKPVEKVAEKAPPKKAKARAKKADTAAASRGQEPNPVQLGVEAVEGAKKEEPAAKVEPAKEEPPAAKKKEDKKDEEGAVELEWE